MTVSSIVRHDDTGSQRQNHGMSHPTRGEHRIRKKLGAKNFHASFWPPSASHCACWHIGKHMFSDVGVNIPKITEPALVKNTKNHVGLVQQPETTCGPFPIAVSH